MELGGDEPYCSMLLCVLLLGKKQAWQHLIYEACLQKRGVFSFIN